MNKEKALIGISCICIIYILLFIAMIIYIKYKTISGRVISNKVNTNTAKMISISMMIIISLFLRFFVSNFKNYNMILLLIISYSSIFLFTGFHKFYLVKKYSR